MTKGKFDTKVLINNPEIFALFGYLVRCNNQIHDFQNKVIKEYAERKGIDYKYVHDVLFYKEDAIKEADAIKLLKKEHIYLQREILFYLIVVSEIDGMTDYEEKSFFDKLKKNLELKDEERIESEAIKKADVERRRFKKQNSVKHTGKRANPNSTDNLFRITQKEYVAAINRCRKNAKADYDFVKPISDSIINKGKEFNTNLQKKLKKEVSFHPEVVESLEAFSKSIEEEVLKEAEFYGKEFAKKGTAVEDFTIALIGRTKAGKSTLRAVLTGEGKENIGIGSQRTTRINDIYEWNHLRIIDTPGIDAGSDAENEDQKIAEKVIGEADVICYIAASDGLPKNAREFAVNIAKKNKPVIVLVNYKSNIAGGRIRRFVENPSAWQNSKGSNAIDGYFKPIKRLAEENGVSELISYRSVFLYADLLSKDSKYAEYSKILNDNSGVNEFLVQLKDAVVNKGTFLRSKTIIDGTVSECYSWVEKITELVKPINKTYESLMSEREHTLNKINKAKNKLLKLSEGIIKNSFKELATKDANDFAEIHYMEKGDLSKSWGEYCKSIGFSEKLQANLTEAFEEFAKEIKTIMDDLFQDLRFDMDNKTFGSSIGGNVNVNFPFRELFRFAGTGLGIVGAILIVALESNPVGWVLSGIGLVVGVVASLFKSKAKRQKEAKDNLYKKIHNAVMGSSEKQQKEILKKLEEQSSNCISQITKQYDNLLNGLKSTTEYCENLIEEMEADINTLNSLFAERIIEYIGDQKVNVSNVKRDFGKSMEIWSVNNVDLSKCDFNKIKGLLNENVTIHDANSSNQYIIN